MTQPKYVPIPLEDEVRPGYRLPTARPWVSGRPAESGPATIPRRGAGVPGPDQGYALRLARRFADRLVLAEDEHAEDVLTGAVVIALRRAALYGRAPVGTDLEMALELFGFLAEAPAELVAARRRLFAGAAHDYWGQRDLAARIPEETLRRSPAELRAAKEPWREVIASATA